MQITSRHKYRRHRRPTRSAGDPGHFKL